MNKKEGIRPGVLAVRAVNQYRRREVFAYLGLRYYLDNTAARTDLWANQVATNLVLTRTNLPYLPVHHFKEATGSGEIKHRPIFLPAPNEALAEAALLAECAKSPAFANPDCVFSYKLNNRDRSGMFEFYTVGLQARHKAIAEACDKHPDGIVRYMDIKAFYPSISRDLALSVWKSHAEVAQLLTKYRDLGEKIINDHCRLSGHQNGNVLTGPMISHLIGNLVLRKIDELSRDLPARYFRYVDDITLVGDQASVKTSAQILKARLGDVGFKIHDESSNKHITVSTKKWLEGRHDFQQSRREISWMSFIANLRRYLISHLDEREQLQAMFRDQGFRIPILDYSNAIFEADWLEKIRFLAFFKWFRWKVQTLSADDLMRQAVLLRKTYDQELSGLLEESTKLNGFDLKRRVPKLRYRVGRLIYLATDDRLASLQPEIKEIPDLHFHAEVAKAVATRNVDSLLDFGTNAAQAAAQPLRAGGLSATSLLEKSAPIQEQALGVFSLNGVQVVHPSNDLQSRSDLMRFASRGVDREMMNSSDPFVRELACLHGLSESPRHAHYLEQAFDANEDLAMDAIEQLQTSISN